MDSSPRGGTGARAKKDIGGSSNGVPTEDPAPVWLACINEDWTYGATPVQLPQVDSRKPHQKCTSAVTGCAEERANGEKNQTKTTEGETEEVTPSPARNLSPTPPTPPPKVNLNLSETRTNSVGYNKSFILNSSPRQTNNSSSLIHALPNPHPHPNLPPHLNLSSTTSIGDAYTDSKPGRSIYPSGASDKDDPKNAVMREEGSKSNAEMEASMQSALPLPTNSWSQFSSGKNSTPSQSSIQLLLAPQPSTRSGAHSPGYPARGSAPGTHKRRAHSRRGVSQLRRSPGSPESARTTPNPAAPHRLAQRRSAQKTSWNSLSQQLQQNGAAVRRENDWTTWVEIGIRVYGLTPTVSTLDLWKCFNREGPITSIKIFEDGKGNREGKASIRFRFVSPLNKYKHCNLLNLEIAHHQQRCSGIPKSILSPLKAQQHSLFGWSLSSPDGYTQFPPLLIHRIDIPK